MCVRYDSDDQKSAKVVQKLTFQNCWSTPLTPKKKTKIWKTPVSTLLQLWLSMGLSGIPSEQTLVEQFGPEDCSAGHESCTAVLNRRQPLNHGSKGKKFSHLIKTLFCLANVFATGVSCGSFTSCFWRCLQAVVCLFFLVNSSNSRKHRIANKCWAMVWLSKFLALLK